MCQTCIGQVLRREMWHGKVGCRIVADQVCRECLAIGQAGGKRLRPGDDMAVGEEITVGGEQDT